MKYAVDDGGGQHDGYVDTKRTVRGWRCCCVDVDLAAAAAVVLHRSHAAVMPVRELHRHIQSRTNTSSRRAATSIWKTRQTMSGMQVW